MADISSVKLPNNTTVDLKDSNAVASLSFSGHTLTATKRGGTTATTDISEFDELTVSDLTVTDIDVTGDITGVTHNDLEPLATATYTGLLGTSSNNAANDSFYFM